MTMTIGSPLASSARRLDDIAPMLSLLRRCRTDGSRRLVTLVTRVSLRAPLALIAKCLRGDERHSDDWDWSIASDHALVWLDVDRVSVAAPRLHKVRVRRSVSAYASTPHPHPLHPP